MQIVNKKGFTLVELLIGLFIFSILTIGTLQMFNVNLLSFGVLNSLQAEMDLKTAVNRAVGDTAQCLENLNQNTGGSNRNIRSLKLWDSTGNPKVTLVDTAATQNVFRDVLEIGDIRIKDDPTAAPGSNLVNLIVTYKRKVKGWNAEEECNLMAGTGINGDCYACLIEYDSSDPNPNNHVCMVQNCFDPGITGPTPPPSLTMGDFIDSKRNAIFGYDATPISVGGWRNSFLGTGAGVQATLHGQHAGSNTFVMDYSGTQSNVYEGNNLFMGTNAGSFAEIRKPHNFFIGNESGAFSEVTGEGNMFLGYKAGSVDGTLNNRPSQYSRVSGDNNMFIGHKAGSGHEVTEDNVVNIGNVMMMKSVNKPSLDPQVYRDLNDDDVQINGNLKVCDSLGADCMVIRKSDYQELNRKVNALCNGSSICNP